VKTGIRASRSRPDFAPQSIEHRDQAGRVCRSTLSVCSEFYPTSGFDIQSQTKQENEYQIYTKKL